mmetsp:Transcript_23475/g.70541  ORF Transcript_23475/g.70541 Transcript_23475/m.70541 type:complete len:213 (-) Transcript_23475:168-806(-)
MTSSRMTELSPGHKPPQVTIAAATSEGLKCRVRRGPARSIWRFTRISLLLRVPKVWVAQEPPSMNPRCEPWIARSNVLACALAPNFALRCSSSSLRSSSSGPSMPSSSTGSENSTRGFAPWSSAAGAGGARPSGDRSGCKVVLTRRTNHRPFKSTRFDFWWVMAWIGSMTYRSQTFPMLTPVYPAMAAWTAWSARTEQYTLSLALGRTARTM